MKKLILMGLCVASLSACTKVEDYLLGQDNTPKPQALEEIKPKVKMANQWSVPVGGKTNTSTYHKMEPVSRGNIIYTADANGQIQAVEQGGNKVLWAVRLQDGIVSGPTVAQGMIAVGTANANLVLLKQDSGKELWRAKLSNEVLAKPLITPEKVIVKTIDGTLVAFDAVSGEKVWVSDHGAPSLVLKVSSAPVLLGDLVLVGYSDGKLDAVNIETGQTVWQRSIAYASGASDVEKLVDIDADPIVRGNVAYLATYQGYVGALSLDNGQFIWHKPASTYKNLVLHGNSLYMTDADDVVWSLDAATGRVNWQQPALKARGLTEPAIMNNRLVVADKTGLVHVLGLDSGKLIGRTQVAGPVVVAPVVADNHLYIQTANGLLNQISVS